MSGTIKHRQGESMVGAVQKSDLLFSVVIAMIPLLVPEKKAYEYASYMVIVWKQVDGKSESEICIS